MASSHHFDLPQFSDAALDRIAHQLASLSRQGGHLTHQFQHQTRDVGHQLGNVAHDLADQALHQGAVAAQELGRQAIQVGKAVRKDPAPALAVAIGVACLISLMLASSGKRH